MTSSNGLKPIVSKKTKNIMEQVIDKQSLLNYFYWRRQHLLSDLSIIKMYDTEERRKTAKIIQSKISEIDKTKNILPTIINQIAYEESKTIHLVKKRRFLLNNIRKEVKQDNRNSSQD
jgi:hypothetical protein